MLTKKFTQLQKDLIKTCCDANLPIVVTSKHETLKNEVSKLIQDLSPTKQIIHDNINSTGEGESNFLSSLNLSMKNLKTKNTVWVMDVSHPMFATLLGSFIKIDVFSQENTEEVHLRISDVSISPNKVTINLSDNINKLLVHDKGKRDFHFNNKGRTISLTEPGIDISTSDVYINSVEQLNKFIENQKSMITFLQVVTPKDLFGYNTVVVVDLRGVRLVAQEVSESIYKLLDIEEKLKKKVVIMTSGEFLFTILNTDKFDSVEVYREKDNY